MGGGWVICGKAAGTDVAAGTTTVVVEPIDDLEADHDVYPASTSGHGGWLTRVRTRVSIT